MKFNSGIIRYTKEKLKSLVVDDTVYTVVLVLLVGIGSFGLGRLSLLGERGSVMESGPRVQLMGTSSALAPKAATSTPPSFEGGQASLKVIKHEAAVVAAGVKEGESNGPYVASKSGSKYYLTSCSGAKRIKEENKVFFRIKGDAIAAGYTPAANCPGL